MTYDHFDINARGRRGYRGRPAQPGHERFHHDDPSEHARAHGFPPFAPGFGPGVDPRADCFGRGPRRRSKGDVRAAILSLLAETEGLNGYAIMKAIAEKTQGAWRASPGSVYPTLQQLVDEELIAARGEGR